MDIVIIADFCGSFIVGGNSRFLYLADLLQESNSVEIITSDFDHGTKTHFPTLPEGFPHKITMLHEPAYKKNICLQRFACHFTWGRNVKTYLKSRKKPDIIYCAIPPLTAAYEAAQFCKRNGVKFIIDIQDLWPEAFRMVFRVPVLSDLFFTPMEHLADSIYSAADEVLAVSQTYVARAMRVNKKCVKPTVVFLGTELCIFDEYCKETPMLNKPIGEVWMAYIGTLGSSYDLISVMDAMDQLKNQRKCADLHFIVIGQGPLRKKFEQYANENSLPVLFTGALPYPKMVAQLCQCDFAVNPIRSGSAGSVINKVGDYAAAGLAVINTQESKEYRSLIDTYGAGINCDNGNIEQLCSAIEILCCNSQTRVKMGEGNRRMAKEIFDRKKIYQKICELIEE